ncbi:phage conserved hypothetical protein BR0599 [Paracoccus isoporae]|uniref:Bacteriophage phiJL001 Gp84 C-terminal domain-containing protein n=1 Tax=Paracoccus isoporae TaxID=591205 RepID=A0A1G7EVD6_9RHOB|nr:DUF2163 domain-containing protein [Paracoccus isoporae]SDE67618.1 phage conserved hypothetical protein BR0599 [Paracoccus isoporae]
MTVTTLARAWAVTRADGVVLGFTDHDTALSFAGISFRPQAGMEAQAVVQGAGLAVDNSEAIGALSDAAIDEADIIAGRWDGAEIRLWEVDWADPAAHRLVFRGSLGEVTRAGGAFRAELRGLSEALNRPVGRVYHPRCSAVLGDGACKADLSRPGLSGEARIEQVSGARLVLSGLHGRDDRWFERGTLRITSGAASGIAGHIKNDRARPEGRREVDLWAAPGILPSPGDAVRLEVGCDKSASQCRLKFGNFANFRGFPHLPQEDWLLAPGAPQPRRAEAQPSFQPAEDPEPGEAGAGA